MLCLTINDSIVDGEMKHSLLLWFMVLLSPATQSFSDVTDVLDIDSTPLGM